MDFFWHFVRNRAVSEMFSGLSFMVGMTGIRAWRFGKMVANFEKFSRMMVLSRPVYFLCVEGSMIFRS